MKSRSAVFGEAPLTYRPFAGLEPVRNRVCASKAAHATKEEAEAHIQSHVSAGRARAPRSLRAYLCSFCRRWHVGHYQLAAAGGEAR